MSKRLPRVTFSLVLDMVLNPTQIKRKGENLKEGRRKEGGRKEEKKEGQKRKGSHGNERMGEGRG